MSAHDIPSAPMLVRSHDSLRRAADVGLVCGRCLGGERDAVGVPFVCAACRRDLDDARRWLA